MTEIKKHYEDNLELVKEDYERRIASLAEKVSAHPSHNVDYEELRRKYDLLEGHFYDMQNSENKFKQANKRVDHLWSIKETEYHNVN